jgi:phenylacetate-CoA ligase
MQLAETFTREPYPVPQIEKLISTAESLSGSDRMALSKAFNAEVYDFYGSTEMGLIGWQCKQQNEYHLSLDSLLVEFLPIELSRKQFRLVVTNLDLAAMPLIRFDTGDLVTLEKNEPCGANREFTKFQQVEGRYIDCIQLKNGDILTPYTITCAMERLPEIGQYQIIQENYHKLNIVICLLSGNQDDVEKNVIRLMRDAISSEVEIAIEFCQSIEMNPMLKSRVVRSLLEGKNENTLHQL